MSRSSVRARLKTGLHARLRALGFDIVRYDGRRFIDVRRLQLIRSRGVSLVIDIGANEGWYAMELRDGGYRGRIVSFEPQRAAFERLAAAATRDASWECRPAAVGARDGRVVLHVAGNSSS